jgi:hypothetical protein
MDPVVCDGRFFSFSMKEFCQKDRNRIGTKGIFFYAPEAFPVSDAHTTRVWCRARAAPGPSTGWVPRRG